MRHALSIATVTCAVALSAGTLDRPALAASGYAPSGETVRIAQNNSGPNTFSLLQDIQRLQEQVRDLQGQVDTLQYQLRQNEQGQRDLYENLDKRLSALEGNGAGMDGRSGGEDYGSGDARSTTGSSQGKTEPQPESGYMKAFDELKNGNYDAAINGFSAFLDQHPDTSYSDNAWYWLGEANFVKRNYSASLDAFQTVVNRFKNSGKIAASLYKIGVIQAEQGQTDNAKATLNRVIDQYPQDHAAELARKRLEKLDS